MTAPNLVNTSQVYMRSNIQVPISSITDILENPAASNMTIRADVVTICNTTASAADIDVYLTRSSTTYAIAKTISVPAYSSLVVLDKDYPLYLKEGDKLQVAGGTGLQAICSYTIISDASITLPGRPNINVTNSSFVVASADFGPAVSSITLPAERQTGDILLFFGIRFGTTVPLPNGYTDIGGLTSGDLRTRIAYRVLDGSESSTLTVDNSTSSTYTFVLCRGVSTTNPLDVGPVSSSTLTPPQISTSVGGLIIASAFAQGNNVSTAAPISIPSGFTLLQEARAQNDAAATAQAHSWFTANGGTSYTPSAYAYTNTPVLAQSWSMALRTA